MRAAMRIMPRAIHWMGSRRLPSGTGYGIGLAEEGQ